MSKKIDELLSQTVDLSGLPHDLAVYVENLRGQLEETREAKNAVINKRLGLTWSPKSYDDRFDDWVNDAVVPVLDAELSRPEGDTGNLIIEGDNIDALRVLARTHKGKIDCIFIDPPYNTENTTFVYNDDFVASEDKYRYSMWLEGLRRRLQYVPDLLSDRGVLLVAINDKNRSYVELLIKEKIMPGKQVGSFVWRTRQGSNNGGKYFFSSDHEHVLVFANDNFAFSGTKKTYDMYKHDDMDGRGVYRKSDLTRPGKISDSPNLYYPLQDPNTGIWYPCNPDRVWVYASRNRLKKGQKLQEKPMEDFIDDGKISFPEGKRVHVWNTMEDLLESIDKKDVPVTGKGRPLLRRGLPDLEFFLGKRIGWGIPQYKHHKQDDEKDAQPLSSYVLTNKEYKSLGDGFEIDQISSSTTKESASHIKDILDGDDFSYTKPVDLLVGLLKHATRPNSYVLDFFGGSGTTAEAVLRLNADDDGDRRFILVSNSERTDKEPEKNLCRDVLRRRVNAVLDGFTKGKKEIEGTGGGYAYLRMERRDEEAICGPCPFEVDMSMAYVLFQMDYGLPVEALNTPETGYVVRETEDTMFVFVPKWSRDLTDAVIEEFSARPEKEHVLVADLDKTPARHLQDAGFTSARCLDAIVQTSRLCGPALFTQRGA